MGRRFFVKISLVCLFFLTILTGCNCCINMSCGIKAEHKKVVQLSAPMTAGQKFSATTHNGSVTISGAEVSDCNVTATLTCRAVSDEEAKKLAEQVKVKLEPSGDGLNVKIEKPSCMVNKSVSVSIVATVPSKTNLELSTYNGSIKVSNLAGDIKGTTHNGKASIYGVSGSLKLHTYNGGIVCKRISGDIRLETHNGKINVDYGPKASPVCNASLITYNGGISLRAPKNFSALVEATTYNGSITTELPITVKGKINKRSLKGTIGKGEGKLYLKTHNGSVSIQ